MKHIQSVKVKKIDQDFIFKNRGKMTKSGSLVNQCEGKKIKNREKPFIFTNWTILSDLENFLFVVGSFKILKTEAHLEKNFIGSRFFLTWNFQGWFLTLDSTIFESFRKILCAVSKTYFNFFPSGSVNFFLLLIINFLQKFRLILWPVREKLRATTS